MNYVIIGNSAAAIGGIEGIRSLDKDGKITVVSSEKYHTYSRPLISYLLCKKTTEEKMKYRSDDFYKKNKCDVILGKKAVKTDGKKVILEDETELPFDKLLIATGSRPFVPPTEGLDNVKEKFTFMSLDDAKALEKSLSKDKKVLIIGAGLIGLKCAEGIFDKVKDITVVDMADRILPSILDEKGSKIVKKHLEKIGIKFLLSDSVKSFSDKEAVLNSGKKLSYDIVVIAVGVRPNTDLAEDAGVKVDRGIETDIYCRTSNKDIYSAGDCAKSLDITTGAQRILALLPNAYMQGQVAGINMAGGDAKYDDAIPMNSIGFFGLHMMTAGSYDGDESVTTDGKNYRKFIVKDNVLKGYILIGDVKRAGIYTSLIRKKTPLDTIDFELVKEKPNLMAFSENEREKMLGGAK